MGQEVIARATAPGHINKQLVGLRLVDGAGPGMPGATLSAAAREDAGVITSSVVSPALGPIALGYLHRSVWAPGTEITVLDGESRRAAVVVELPFRAS